MKFLFYLFIILSSTVGIAQVEETSATQIKLNDEVLINGAIVALTELKNITIVSDHDAAKLEVQFVIVPIGMDLLSFRMKLPELSTMKIFSQRPRDHRF